MVFKNQYGLDEHYKQSAEHHYCIQCGDEFDSLAELTDHRIKSHHFCAKCNKFFSSLTHLEEHYKDSDVHHYCVECKKEFYTESHLRSHLKSKAHSPPRFACDWCPKTFVLPSSLVLHWEAGFCPSGWNRTSVRDAITNSDDVDDFSEIVRLCIHTNGLGVDFQATKQAYDPSTSMYRCHLCPAQYWSFPDLQRHLASRAHKGMLYVCSRVNCHHETASLGAMFQHFEDKHGGTLDVWLVLGILRGALGYRAT
ncbi:hypothetical protein HGRIS_008693 [Hohenbuehelia grisea]|uniref:C2H2-type domain-containing protein n=1 Tax=Hohenbuehelia grisea TaxID=104357 RepID=A0ABR3J8R4_9AGAR